MEHDIRWHQRFDNFKKALLQLSDAITIMQDRELTNLEKQGVIQAFEFTYELAWNVLKDYLLWQGFENVVGSRDTIRESFKNKLIDDGQLWMNMLQDRNRTVHTYNEATAKEIIQGIQQHYFAAFNDLKQKFELLK